MSDITVTFKNETILTMDASGSKDLLTQGKYCEDDISITYVKPGGGTTISTAVDAIKAYLESNGFVLSEFTVQTPESGDYFSIPHSLGRVPDLVCAFNKDLYIGTSAATGYQFGCASSGNYGSDNNNNRTYTCTSNVISGSLLYTDCLKNFPLSINRSQYNFCRSASSTAVEIRNGSFANTHMLGTTWILAVK